MGKLGGLVLIAALSLTGCSAPASGAAPAGAGDVKLGQFVADIRTSGTAYANMPAADIADMAKDLCQHYAGGFTTDDLRKSAGDKLAKAGEAARLTVCPAR